MRMLSNARLSSTSDEGQPLPPVRSGYSYHNTGNIVSIDHEALVLVLAITQSTEDIATGTQVSVDCASTEHFDVPFDELAVAIACRSAPLRLIPTAPSLRRRCSVRRAIWCPSSRGASRKKRSTTSCVVRLRLYGVGHGDVGRRGERVPVSRGRRGRLHRERHGAARVHRIRRAPPVRHEGPAVVDGRRDRRLLGTCRPRAVLRAKVIVGNDDTSSDYWENMPAS